MSNAKTYLFRRCDNDAMVEVSWFVMMHGQDRAGFITLGDGTKARRAHDLELERDGGFELGARNKMTGTIPRHWSDALGFSEELLPEYEKDRHDHGFSGVEFRRDPTCPEFMQVSYGGPEERQRYIKHRGMVDKGGGLGAGFITEHEIQSAEKRAKEQYGEPHAG